MSDRNKNIAVEMLDEIDRCRSGQISLEELEEKLWRLLDAAETGFPLVVAGQVEDLVQALRRLREENRELAKGSAYDPDAGTESIYNEVIGSLTRYLA